MDEAGFYFLVVSADILRSLELYITPNHVLHYIVIQMA